MSVRRIVLIAALLGISPSLLAASDPFTGTWKLVMEDGKRVTRSNVRRMEATANRVKVFRRNDMPNGTPDDNDWEATLDGKESPIKNDPNVTSVTLTRITPNFLYGYSKRDGKVTGMYTWEVSKDGKNLIRKWARIEPPGRFSVEIFEKQPETLLMRERIPKTSH